MKTQTVLPWCDPSDEDLRGVVRFVGNVARRGALRGTIGRPIAEAVKAKNFEVCEDVEEG